MILLKEIAKNSPVSISKFKSGTQIALHWNENHPEEPMPEKCDKCSFRTCTKNNLLNHIKNNHSGVFYCTLCDYSCHNKLTFDET